MCTKMLTEMYLKSAFERRCLLLNQEPTTTQSGIYNFMELNFEPLTSCESQRICTNIQGNKFSLHLQHLK